MAKTWIISISLAFGIGFGLNFAVTRNMKSSALVGLVSISASASAFIIVNRQRQQEATTVLTEEIRILQQQTDGLNRSLQVLKDNYTQTKLQLEAKTKELSNQKRELENEKQKLKDQLTNDRREQERIQQELNNLVTRRQYLTNETTRLENKLQQLQSQQSELISSLEQLQKQNKELKKEQEKLLAKRDEIDREIQQYHQQEATTVLTEEIRILQQQTDRLNRSLQELQDQLITDAQELSSLQYELETLQQNKETLQQTVNLTKQKAKQVERHLEELSNQKRELENERQKLKDQLTNDRREQERLQQELNNLVTQRQYLTNETARLENKLQQLQAQQSELTSSLEQLQKQNNELKKDQDKLLARRDEIDREIQQYHQQHNTLRQSLVDMVDTQDIERLTEEATAKLIEEQDNPSQSKIQSAEKQQTKQLPPPVDLLNTDNASISYASASKANQDESSRKTTLTIRDTKKIPSLEEFTLSNPDHTKWLWEDVLLPRWQHPPFLGSICLPFEDTDEVWGTETILDIVGKNLRNLGTNNLNYDRVCERFCDKENLNWLKILTFAMSEYAYYMDSEDNFWQGLCKRLGLIYKNDNAPPVTTLKQIAEDGFDLLKLPRATEEDKAYKIVSTLWLQSGLPKRNLHHFAELVSNLINKLSWQEIKNTDTDLLAGRLLNTCQTLYPGRIVLKRFLCYSCQKKEPISGELLQGIASVAIALQEYNQKPEILLDPAQRQEFLVNNVTQFKFFLRDWEALIQILNSDRSVTNRHRVNQKSLVLQFNLENDEIELVLPAQSLNNGNWLPGKCYIRQVDWEGEIDETRQVEIPEMTKSVKQVTDIQHWKLLDVQGNILHSWNIEEIMPQLPCLIFDALTGDRLIPPDELKGKTKIICFFDRTVQLEISEGIEIIDDFVPCSISGWRGQPLYLISETAQLEISKQIIKWDRSQINYPQLRGIKSKSKGLTYLEVPSIWYPPMTIPKTINIEIENIEDEIENIEDRQVLTKFNEKIDLSISSNWQEINLSRWIKHSGSGTYAVKLWCESERWSEEFKLMSSFSLKEAKTIPTNKVYDRTNTLIQVPRQVPSKTEFWLEELTLRDLWTLEEVKFLLSNGQENYSFVKQADISGTLLLNLAALRDVLPESDWYSLSYQRSGEEIRSLLEISTGESISCTWAKNSIHLSGLHPGASYTISVWNLLRPSQIIKSISISEIETDHNLEELLSDIGSLGIFLIWLQTSGAFTQVLGWWSNITKKESLLPNGFDFNYCCNILDNEPLDDFVKLIRNISFRIELEHIRKGISSLQKYEGYLPNWLDWNLLAKKLEKISEPVPASDNFPVDSSSAPTLLQNSALDTNKRKIIHILWNHRQSERREYPRTLTLKSIVSLIEHSLSPDHTVDSEEIRECLQEMQAEGEVLAGTGNKLCMAPPTVVVEDEVNRTEVLFRGDRAYLRLAHQALETGQPLDTPDAQIVKTQLRPKIQSFYQIKERLKNRGIRLLTITDSLEHLPLPEKPKLYLLADALWHENPFQVFGQIKQYVPQEGKTQRERWQTIERADQRSSQLLRLSTREYLWLWFEEDQFYKLSPDEASLAMFWLDQKEGIPLKVPWDEQLGRLNLSGITLPSSYFQFLRRLSQPYADQKRIRQFNPNQRAIVRQALTRLGCQLV